MFSRGISFMCIFVVAVIATNCSHPQFITGSDRDVTTHHLRTDNPEPSTVEPDQGIKQTTVTDLGALLDAGDGATVTLVAGETRLAAHRAVLAARSPVLASMLSSDTFDASSGQVAVPDVEGPVLRQLLAFLYTLQAPQLPDMASQLLTAADRYGVPALKAACEQQVAMQLSVDTAAATAVLALKHSLHSLGMAALNYIREHLAQVMNTQGWADAVHTEPEYVHQVTRLLFQPPVETSMPATTGSSRPSPGTQPHSEHIWTATTAAALSSAVPITTLTQDADVSHMGALPTAASGITPSSSRTPAPTATPTALCPTPPPDDPAVSRLRMLTAEEKIRRLSEAAFEGDVAALQATLAAGVDAGAANWEGWTALHSAAAWGHLEAARCLLASGAPVDARTNSQRTPLHYAVSNGRVGAMRLLLAAGAEPNARDYHGRTPLYSAALTDQAEAAAALLAAGADRAATDNYGATPLDVAKKWGYQQLIDMLK